MTEYNTDLQLLNGISTYLQATGAIQVGFRVDNYCFIMYHGKKFKITVEETT